MARMAMGSTIIRQSDVAVLSGRPVTRAFLPVIPSHPDACPFPITRAAATYLLPAVFVFSPPPRRFTTLL